MITQIKLKAGKEQSLYRKHPWIFSGAILQKQNDLHPGDIVEVVNHQGHYLGHGHYSQGSIAVRMFSFEGYSEDENFWLAKLQSAYETRLKCGLAGSKHTNIYRLVHAEGDGLPGLIIDIYANTAVIQCHSSGMHRLKEVFASGLKKIYGTGLQTIYDKSAEKLKQNTGDQIENKYLSGELQGNIALENGYRFLIDWEHGQKTGFFIDQRDNRQLLGRYAHGKKILNTFCYTGGFSVYALANGAESVDSLDSSQRALDITSENIKLNSLDTARHSEIKADALDYLKEMSKDYDIIVLDPPAFAKHLSARHKAVQGYMRINEAALKKIKSGGLLFTFSCSQAVDKELFRSSVTAAAIHAGRSVRILHQLHQPVDHPISIYHPEGEYLKGLVLEVI